jgi:hypothetical protein
VLGEVWAVGGDTGGGVVCAPTGNASSVIDTIATELKTFIDAYPFPLSDCWRHATCAPMQLQREPCQTVPTLVSRLHMRGAQRAL